MAISKEQLVIELKTKGVNLTKGQLNQLDKSTKGATKSFAAMAVGIAGATAAMYALGKAISVGKQFEQSMANVKAVSGATNLEFKALEANAKKLGATTAFTASEVAGLQTEFAKLGFTSTEINKVTKGTLALAAATGSDLATSAEVGGATLRGFGLDASETGRVTDVMAKSFSSSALDMAKFSDSMKFVAPVAKMAGFSIEGTTAILGQLANAGLHGSMAGTALRSIFLKLANTNSTLSKRLGGSVNSVEELIPALNKLKDEGVDLTEMLELTDKRAVTAFGVLLDGSNDVDKLAESLRNAGGSAQRMADIQLDTLEGRMTIMNSAMEGLGIEIYDLVKGPLKDMVDAMTELIGTIDAETIKSYAVAIGVAATAYGVYATATAIATAGTVAFTSALMSTGIGAIAVGIGILTARLLMASDIFKEAAGNIHLSAGAMERADVAFKTFNNRLEKMKLKEMQTELALLRVDQKSYTDELKENQDAIDELNGSYADYLKNQAKDDTATKNLLKQYDAYVNTQEMLVSVTGQSTMTLEDWIVQQEKLHGTIGSNIQSEEDWRASQETLQAEYRVLGDIAQMNADQIQKEIDALIAKKAILSQEEGGADVSGVPTPEQMEIAKEMMDLFNEEMLLKDEDHRLVKLQAEETAYLEEIKKLEITENQKGKLKQTVINKYDAAKIKLNKAIKAEELKLELQQNAALLNAGASLIQQFAGGAKIAARMQQTAAIINTWAGATAALAPPPVGAGPVAGIPLAATIVMTGLANVMRISKSIGDFKFAQFGMNEVVDKPTMIMAGEGNKAEQVSITPLEGENKFGPSGGSVTHINLNIQGNVLTDEFTENQILPAIHEALRKGESGLEHRHEVIGVAVHDKTGGTTWGDL